MQGKDVRAEWIEPKIETLEIEDTYQFPFNGTDGGRLPDELAS